MPVLLKPAFHASSLHVVFVVSIVLLAAAGGLVALGALGLIGAGWDSASAAVPVTGLPF